MPFRLLVADDSSMQRKVIKRRISEAFADREVEFLDARDGREALACAREESPDLVLLDLTMPEMDGFEALRQIRAARPDVPVVVVSADVQPLARERVREAGAVAFLEKPLDGAALAEVLRDHGIG
ncbi:MAG: response regulator [Myxococcota bacterium]